VPSPRSASRSAAFTLLAVLLGLAAIEGISAAGLRLADAGDPVRHPVAERQHTRYDPELGWVNKPSVHVEDLYGPGRSLTTNAQGFRGTRDYAREVPPGRVRLLCSGDSFTLGWGVGDADTWPARLERQDDRIETINMGQGGYGIDQAYLWARRDGAPFARDLHLFGIISEDFRRMRHADFRGTAKPTLRLEAGVPVAAGVPVPRGRQGLAPWERLNTVRALRRVLHREPPDAAPVLALSEAAALAERALVTLDRDNRARGSRLVAIWLPTLGEYDGTETDLLRTTFLAHLRDADVLVVDLVADLRRRPAASVDSLFLTQDDVVFPVGGRHYSAAGNAFVARALWERLRTMPPFTPPSSD
jgi:hypothetical protein